MTSPIKRLVSRAVASDHVWAVLDATVLKAARYAESERLEHVSSATTDVAIQALFPDLAVRHGPFQGMRYPQAESVGSTLFPKLLGSYEREIQPMVETICGKPYTEIVDIGCAEGYYAVGLAMRIPSATVFAFDTDRRAIDLCRRMAELNGVGERVVAGSPCSTETLLSLPLTKKALVVCDCEGCEKELFTEETVSILRDHDVLVEVHDLIDIEISSLIRRRFEATHSVEVVRSTDDIEKAQTYVYEELSAYDLATRRTLLGERRTSIMEWFYLTPRSDGDGGGGGP
jgi:precorrin-6B methylase 2